MCSSDLNNPTGTFDNDRYLLEIIVSNASSIFEDFVTDWTTPCVNCDISGDTVECQYCTIGKDLAPNEPLPLPPAPVA